MKNILSTIPKGKYKQWAIAERICLSCTGDPHFWLLNIKSLPSQSGVGAQCFMVFDGMVRGYFDIVGSDLTENCRTFHRIGKPRNTQSLILANWHPIAAIEQRGFMGYRYTELKP